ncbi:DnaA N-terminal domain-containing protein [Priestia megaterium]|uniref:DnaA N-terminal domain-containing protein n=1 Tax=Priestia megaterium TaxID=1404 RepID=UPI002E2075A5|nr:DnaA N-terminal domain-containing protein [Priestia megaterium]
MTKQDLYKDYRANDYTHFRLVPTGETKIQKVKGKPDRVVPVLEKRKIPFEEIKSLRLDEYGTLAPPLDTEDFTIVSNYLLDFWGAVLGSEVVQTYIHLKRHAHGKKDFCFPDIELISLKMNKSKNSVKKYIKILEEYHFVTMFSRSDNNDNNRDVSPLFKIRRHVPMITDEMYNNLPEKMQEYHDDFMAEYHNLNLDSLLTETDMAINAMIEGKDIIESKKNKEARNSEVEKELITQDKKDYIISNMEENDIMVNSRILEEIKTHISKPSFDSWFENTVFKFDNVDGNEKLMVLCSTSFVLDWVRERYKDNLRNWLSEAGYIEEDCAIEFYLFDSYISR